MAFKIVAVCALLTVVNAGIIAQPAQVYHAAPAAVVNTISPIAVAHQPVYAKADEEYDPHPQYKYGYDVQDAISGDSKSQVEERDGDVVHGEYSLIDSDGFKRTVQYTADPVNGFNAVVNREPLALKAIAAPVSHYSSPAVVKTVAPVAQYATPITHYSAPTVVKTIAPVTQYATPTVVKTVSPVLTSYSAPASYVAHH